MSWIGPAWVFVWPIRRGSYLFAHDGENGGKRLVRLIVGFLLLVSGCTVYAPLETDPAPAKGTEVRVGLTTPGAVRVTDLLGRPVRNLEGSLVGWSVDSLYLGLISATEFGRPWESMDTLSIARSELLILEEKRLDPLRTGLAVGGGALVTGIGIVALWRAATNDENPGHGEGPDVILIPLFSFVHR